MPESNPDMDTTAEDDPERVEALARPDGADRPLVLQGPPIESPAIATSRREVVRALAMRTMGWGTGAAVITGGMAAALTSTPLALLFTLIFAGTGLAGLAAAFGGRSRGAAAPGSVQRRGDALVIARGGEEQSIPLADVQQGWLEEVPGGDAFEVVLRRQSRHELHIQVASRAEGEALLRTAGVAVADRVLRIPVRSQAATRRRGELLGVIGMVVLLPHVFVGGGGLVAFMLLFLKYGPPFDAPGVLALLVGLLVTMNAVALLGVGWLARYLRRREAIIGTDGVAVEGYGKRRFMPYSRVTRVARDAAGVRLYLRDGLSYLLPTIADAQAPLPITEAVEIPEKVRKRGSEALYRKDVARREALLGRIQQAMAAQGSSRVANVQLEQLDRGKRSVGAWRDDLKKLLSAGGSSYRGPALGTEQLAEVVEDAAAPPERRVAAAVAIAGSGDAEAQRRVRIAVEACADEDLGAALAQAAEGEIEERELQKATLRLGPAR